MSSLAANSSWTWLCTGDMAFQAMLSAIEAASRSVALETYIYSPGGLGEQFLAALVAARRRGVRVRVLVDYLGSLNLPGSFFQPLVDAGGEARFFNPLSLHRLGIRNHRKLLTCDGEVAFIGGFNIAPEFEGDGVTRGWRDIGLELHGPLVAELETSFDEMFDRAEFRHKRFIRFRKPAGSRVVSAPQEQLLLSGPGRGWSPFKRKLRDDLRNARDVSIITAYFLPTWRMRRALMDVVRRGGRVRLILAGKSDVLVSQLAAQSLYRRLLKAGLEIFEYQPQILHAKLVVVDDAVYIGSANFDPRSLKINYELMLRFENPEMANQAREIFLSDLQHARAVTYAAWRQARTFWSRLKQRWAYFLIARIDPYIAQRQWRALPD